MFTYLRLTWSLPSEARAGSAAAPFNPNPCPERHKAPYERAAQQ